MLQLKQSKRLIQILGNPIKGIPATLLLPCWTVAAKCLCPRSISSKQGHKEEKGIQLKLGWDFSIFSLKILIMKSTILVIIDNRATSIQSSSISVWVRRQIRGLNSWCQQYTGKQNLSRNTNMRISWQGCGCGILCD